MIKLLNIKKYYGNKRTKFLALRINSLHIKEGEFLAVVGKSGSGKSTLLNLIGTVDKIDTGEYILDNEAIHLKSERAKATLRNKQIGFVIQSFGLLNDYTSKENILLPVPYLANKKNYLERYEELINSLNIQTIQTKYPDELSGGEQQRVAIARALINNPRLILADEPTGNLDQENARLVLDLLKKENQKGRTICLVTHDEDLAKEGSRLIRLENGFIIEN